VKLKKNYKSNIKYQFNLLKLKKMKIKTLMLVALMMMGAGSLFAQDKTEKFEVKGNCGMCKARIEKAALSVDGAIKTDWNKETKMMKMVFDNNKADVNKVQMAIAKAGHDTKMHKASDKAYEKLAGCCKYDRTEANKGMTGHEGHIH
jgi:periplasmic mercuric ion binding protein